MGGMIHSGMKFWVSGVNHYTREQRSSDALIAQPRQENENSHRSPYAYFSFPDAIFSSDIWENNNGLEE